MPRRKNPLHIPHKFWPDHGQEKWHEQELQNYLAIERWANQAYEDLYREEPDGGGDGCCCFHLIGWSCDGGLTPYQATGYVYLGYEFGINNIEVETIEIVTPAGISGLTFTLDGKDFTVDDEESGWIKFVLADMDIEINGTMGDRWAFSFNVTSEEEVPDLSTYHGIVQINGTGICGYQTVSLYGGT